jgi:hypothetical protein
MLAMVGLTVSPISAAVLYSDDFNADTSANYTVLKVADSTTLDSAATFAYDYSADGIASAPSGSGTVGLKLEANNGDATEERAAINVYPTGQSFPNNIILKFDMWLNFPTGATGATEFGLWGINCSGTKANADPGILGATDTDGYFWGITGDGDSATDSRSYEGVAASAATNLAPPEVGFIDDADDNGDTLYQDLFPSPPAEIAGAAGKQWVRVEMKFKDGNYKIYLNDTLVYDRTDSTYTSGNIFLGYQDTYTSISETTSESFGIFDNLVVEEGPVPPTATPTPLGFSDVDKDWMLYK